MSDRSEKQAKHVPNRSFAAGVGNKKEDPVLHSQNINSREVVELFDRVKRK